MLAHFPVACWVLASVADFASVRFGQPAWHLAGTLLWIGILVGVPTLFTGVFALIRVPDEPAPMRAMFIHMGLMMTAFVLYLISLLLRVHDGHIVAPDAGAMFTSILGLVAVLAGGWFGGTLVYGHGVGGVGDHD